MAAELKEKAAKVLGLAATTYKRRTIKFRDDTELVAKHRPGDRVGPKPEAVIVGLDPKLEYECLDIKADDARAGRLNLKDKGLVQAEWLVPAVSRYERVRRRLDLAQLAADLGYFGGLCAERIKGTLASKVERAQAEVETQRAKLQQAEATLEALKSAVSDPLAFGQALARRMRVLVDSGLYAAFELVDDDKDALYAYTATVGQRRLDFLVKVFPPGGGLRIQVSCLTPGEQWKVPFDENKSGLANVCFGHLAGDVQRAVNDEEWVKVLTLIHDFLDGDGVVKN